MYVPGAVRANETERGRLEILLRRVDREADRYSEGQLQKLLSEQNNLPEHNEYYQSAVSVLDRMVGRVAP
ncbi:hypothetical protein [Streptomyces sp. LN245]|uniref:hypothetical protein n=1 Tax=Streptomyces sp. LN245 TaxID=3112975 RepID=UPI00371C89A1